MRPSARLAQHLLEVAMDGVPAYAAPRSTPRARARMAAVWALRRLCPGVGYPTLGHHFGYSDHTSALNAVTKIDALRNEDEEILAKTDGILLTARETHARLIDEINNVCKPRSSAEELQSVITDVRRAAERLNEAVARLDIQMERWSA